MARKLRALRYSAGMFTYGMEPRESCAAAAIMKYLGGFQLRGTLATENAAGMAPGKRILTPARRAGQERKK